MSMKPCRESSGQIPVKDNKVADTNKHICQKYLFMDKK